jgi:thymidylate synthase
MNNLDKTYTDLLQDILDNGVKKETRNGGTISVFGRQIRHNMKDGFPLLTTKKMAFKTMVTELLWFLRGDTSIEYLLENDCNIWTGDAYKNYTKYPLATIHDHHTNILYQNRDKGWCMLNGRSMVSPHPTRHLTQEEFINKIKTDDEFAKTWGELGPIYGKQWRSWRGDPKIETETYGAETWNHQVENKIDQIANLINDLKTNPDSRRLMVNAWNIGELEQMTLPPCHFSFQVYTRELSEDERNEIRDMQYFKNNLHQALKGSDTKIDWENIPTRAISLMYNARSQDVPLGTPFNIASYALLLEIIAKMVNMVPDELITNMGDCHIYLNQIDGIKEQLTRKPYKLPKLVHMKTDDFYKSLSNDLSLLTHLDNTDFVVENYQSHPSIKMPLSN